MANEKSEAGTVNIIAFPPEKMDEVLAALKPILGASSGYAGGGDLVLRDSPGSGTGCTRTTQSDDWTCTDFVALE